MRKRPVVLIVIAGLTLAACSSKTNGETAADAGSSTTEPTTTGATTTGPTTTRPTSAAAPTTATAPTTKPIPAGAPKSGSVAVSPSIGVVPSTTPEPVTTPESTVAPPAPTSTTTPATTTTTQANLWCTITVPPAMVEGQWDYTFSGTSNIPYADFQIFEAPASAPEETQFMGLDGEADASGSWVLTGSAASGLPVGPLQSFPGGSTIFVAEDRTDASHTRCQTTATVTAALP